MSEKIRETYPIPPHIESAVSALTKKIQQAAWDRCLSLNKLSGT